MERPLKFPAGFVWGCATSALQIEGATREDGRGESVWDAFCRDRPERFFERATPEPACDHYHRWAEDVALMAELGLNGYRLSISWPRLFPRGGGRINDKGASFYDRLFDALLEAGIEPNVTLYHWDLPAKFGRWGGWENPDTCKRFAEYAHACLRRYGDRVRLWSTLNEPSWSVLNGYVTGLHPPCKSEDFAGALRAADGLLRGHALACAAAHEERGKAAVGIVLNMSPIRPATGSTADERAARLADGMLNRWFSEAVLDGRFPSDMKALYTGDGFLPKGIEETAKLLRRAPLDFLGVNYYYPHHASANAPHTSFHLNTSGRAEEDCEFSIAGLFRFVKNKRGRFTAWGWEIDPDGLFDLLMRVHQSHPGLPLYVTENGIGRIEKLEGGTVDDGERIDFIRAHLDAVHRAISAGAAVRGYYLWSLMDNFSWINGYKKRYGLLFVDRKTLKRYKKRSAFWFRDAARANAV
ncbi:MAG: GH1 family beta-glucosidase [Elusimicrobia bacterium]|nr:GH1 family beta-glucosidase [Elusimicrobiota bacterium]